MVQMDHVVGGKFKLGRKIGSGSFGELYLGIAYEIYFPLVFLLLIYHFSNIYFVLCFNLFTGVNVQTGEEVAVKLVNVVFGLIKCSISISCWLVYDLLIIDL